MPPGGNGRVWLVFTGINAPVFRLTDRAQLPSSSKLKNPPGHKPSFWLSRLIVRSPRPPYCQALLLPPLTTPCPIWVTFRSMVILLKNPHFLFLIDAKNAFDSNTKVARDKFSSTLILTRENKLLLALKRG